MGKKKKPTKAEIRKLIEEFGKALKVKRKKGQKLF